MAEDESQLPGVRASGYVRPADEPSAKEIVDTTCPDELRKTVHRRRASFSGQIVAPNADLLNRKTMSEALPHGPLERRSGSLGGGGGSVASGWKVCQCLFGWRSGKSFWGLDPFDLGAKVFPSKHEPWYKVIGDGHDHGHGHGHGHHAPQTWWNTPWYTVPKVRHLWGESQEEVHAGGQELFLDLIFVGVAYRVGVVVKEAFYYCDNGLASASGSSSGSSSGYSSYSYASNSSNASGYAAADSGSSSGSGRMLEELYGLHDALSETPGRGLAAASSSPTNECISLGLGLFHALAPFICMYLLWGIETSHKARFSVDSKVHYVLDLCSNFLLILAGMNMEGVHTYRGAANPTTGK